MPQYSPPKAQTFLTPGDAAPSFRQRTASNPAYAFDSAAGRYLVLCYYASAADAASQAALQAVLAREDLFDDTKVSFFGVSCDPMDESQARVVNRVPGIRHFWDQDLLIARLYGMLPRDVVQGATVSLQRQWVVIDPSMRVIAAIPFKPDRSDIDQVLTLLDNLPPPDAHAGQVIMAPVLLLPRVFEPALCDHLVGLYDAEGGTESGFMRESGGKTVGVIDPSFKRRRDHAITDEALKIEIQTRILRKVVPEIAKVHQFHVTRMERYIVSCYSQQDGGHFAAHRDNTTKGTAHRRFAVSINLNEDFDGGEVSFPEYGPRSFKAPKGAAVVFSCSLLHAVSRVTRGARYAFLPFLYDDAAANLREKNQKFLAETTP